MFRWLGDVEKPKDDLSQVYLARRDPSFQSLRIQANLNKIKLNKGPDQFVCLYAGAAACFPLVAIKTNYKTSINYWNFLWMQLYCIILCSRTTIILCKYFRACDLSFMFFVFLAYRRGQRLFVSWPHGSSWGRWQHWESRELWMRSTGTAWSTECQLEVGHVK